MAGPQGRQSKASTTTSKRLTEVWVEHQRPGPRVVEDNQRGILSPATSRAPIPRVHEGGVIQFVDWYVDTLGSSFADRALVAAE